MNKMSNEEENQTIYRFIDNLKCKQNHDHIHCKRKLSDIQDDDSYNSTPDKKSRLNHSGSSLKLPSPWEPRRVKAEESRANITVTSPWEGRRLKSDLSEARSRILTLESQIQQLHAVRKELELVFENEKTALQNAHKRDQVLINELESRITLIREREAETKSDYNELRHKFESNKIKYERRLEHMQQKMDKLKEDVLEVSHVEQENQSMASQRIFDLEDALSAAEDEAASQKQLVEQLQSQLSQANATQRDLEIKEQALQKALLQIKELEYEKASHQEWQQQAKLQQKKINEYSKFEKEVMTLREENRNLRDAIQNKLLLEEQVLDLQKHLEMSKSLHKDLADFEVKYSHLESKLNSWTAFAREICDSVEPDCNLQKQLKRKFEECQQKEVIITSEKITLEHDLRAAQRDLTNKKSEIEKLNSCVSDLQTLSKNHQTLIHRLQKKLLLISRERDSYRSQLDSYEKELTINPDATQRIGTDDMQRNRLETCEKLIDEYRDLISKLENDLEVAASQSQTMVPVRMEQMKRLQAEVSQLRSENEKILKKRTELEKELEHRALQNDTDAIKIMEQELTKLRNDLEVQTTQNVQLQKELNDLKKAQPKLEKVLHMNLNPFSEAAAQHDADVATLKVEIDRLKRKIHNLEEGIEVSKTETSFQVPTQEIIALREQVKSYNLKEKRLKQVFRETSQKFKEACYLLFGFKMDKMMDNSNYRLLSMYADSQDDYLLFNVTEDGCVNLLETRFSSDFDDLIELHLRQHASFPLFLAAITERLFSRQTQATMSNV